MRSERRIDVSNWYFPLSSERGQGLIQVMIGVAIMGIVMAGFARMMSVLQRQSLQSSEKIASIDLARVVTQALSDPEVCTKMVEDAALPAFNPETIKEASSSPVEFNLPNIPATAQAGGPIAVPGPGSGPASPLVHSLEIQSLKLTDLSCGASPCTSGSTTFSGNVELAFDNSKLVMGLKPLKFPVIVGATGPAGNRTIVNCTGGVPPPCIPSIIAGCNLPATASGSPATGACDSGYTGSCSYTCNLGMWTMVSNTCTTTGSGCPATTIADCSLPAIPSGRAYGYCVVPGSGFNSAENPCSYTCTGSTWGAPMSGCSASPPPPTTPPAPSQNWVWLPGDDDDLAVGYCSGTPYEACWKAGQVCRNTASGSSGIPTVICSSAP